MGAWDWFVIYCTCIGVVLGLGLVNPGCMKEVLEVVCWRDAVEAYSQELLLVALFSVQNCLLCRSCIIFIFASYFAFLVILGVVPGRIG